MRFGSTLSSVAASVAILLPTAVAVTCNLKGSAQLATANGWQAQLVVQGLTTPRGVVIDTNGNLLVLQRGNGIVHLAFNDGGSTCLEVAKKTFLVNATELNHGIALSTDGKTLYASSSGSVFSWAYDAAAVKVSSTNRTVVVGMTNNDHTTRTLLISKKAPGILVVSRGSNENIDVSAATINSGHSQIRAFNLTNLTSTSAPYDFTTQGKVLGWGLRNSVGVAEEPSTGGIYSVENSVDSVDRDGVDIHQDNPGEELNYHGFLNGSTVHQGGNYGYPYCFAVWNTSIPGAPTLKTGDQFALDQNSTINDTFCATEKVAPRLTFQAHLAPLDIHFQPNGTEAFVSMHGSFDRSAPVGYKVSTIAFANGSPVAPADSMTALTDIFYNADNSICPDKCFRPVGLALDAVGRLFVTSDNSGEIYVLVKTGGSTATTTTPPTPSASKKSAGAKWYPDWFTVSAVAVGFAALLL